MSNATNICSNMNIPPELVGMTSLLSPGMASNSGGRLDMYSSHLSAWRVPKDGDTPIIFSPFESLFIDYTFDTTTRDNAIKVVQVIPKYDIKYGVITLGNNPTSTVIYRDLETGEMSYFNLHKYTCLTNGFGYKNNIKCNLMPGTVLDPDDAVYDSDAISDSEYRMGVNANVAFMSTLDGTEDAICISEEISEKLTPTAIDTITIKVNLDQYPLNLYGNDSDYKILPDIGDVVNEDGIIFGSRIVNDISAITDLDSEKLSTVNYLFDQLKYTHPGATVIDIEVYLDSKVKLPPSIYDQLIKYRNAKLEYYSAIDHIYEDNKNIPISNKLNTLIKRAKGRLLAAKKNVKDIGKRNKVRLVDRIEPVALKVEITVKYDVLVNKGHKSTGRDGAKGVIVVTKPRSEMPTDEYGVVADICIDPLSVHKRTNLSQIYEQYIGRLLLFITRSLSELPDTASRFNKIVEVLYDINPIYSNIVNSNHKSERLREEFVQACMEDGIRVCIPPSMKGLDSDLITRLDDKYKIPVSRVSFIHTLADGTKKKITTKEPILIGPKYIYLLNKFPRPIANGYSYVNKYHFPVSARSGPVNRNKDVLGTTSIRLGEAEFKILTTAVGSDVVLRLKALFGNSVIGPKAMINALLSTKYPSRLKCVNLTDEELKDDLRSTHILKSYTNAMGIDLQNVLISDKHADEIYEDLDTYFTGNDIPIDLDV